MSCLRETRRFPLRDSTGPGLTGAMTGGYRACRRAHAMEMNGLCRSRAGSIGNHGMPPLPPPGVFEGKGVTVSYGLEVTMI